MRGFSKSSIWMAAGIAFASGLVLLQPTEASAQFNIEGIIRGALQQQGCCYGGGYYRNRSSGSGTTRHVKSPQKDDSASDPVDKTKERDATQLEPPSNNVASGRQQLSAPAPSPPSQPDTSTRQSNAPRGNDDQPAFAPSR